MPTVRIILRNLKLSCSVGIDVAEQYVRQPLNLDVSITLHAANTAGKTPTLDYAQVTDKLRALASSAHFPLLEDFAMQAAEEIINYPAVSAVQVHCAKPAIFADLEQASVEVCLP